MSSHRFPVRRTALVLLLGAFWYAPVSASLWHGETVVKNGVTHLISPAEPMFPAETIHLDEMWRLGGESELDEQIFGQVQRVLVDEEGRSYFLDIQLNEVRVFAPDGRYVTTLSRDGEGPGEFRNGSDFFFLPDRRLAISQIFPSRVPTVDTGSGDARNDLRLPHSEGGGHVFVQAIAAGGGVIALSFVVAATRDNEGVNDQILATMDGDGNLTGTLHKKTIKLDEARGRRDLRGESYLHGWQIGADGLVYVAPSYIGYRVEVYAPDGELVRIIEREYTSLQRTDAELEQIKRTNAARFGRHNDPDAIDPLKKDIDTIITRDDGTLWVLSSRGATGHDLNTVGTFDVFDAQGRFSRQVTVEAQYEPKYDRFVIAGDRLFVLKEANSAPDMTSTTGNITIRRSGGSNIDDDRDQVPPFEIICYSLPLSQSADDQQ